MCSREASRGGREWAEMTEGFHLEATRHRVKGADLRALREEVGEK